MTWPFWCLLSSLLGGLFLWVNGHYRMPSLALILGRSVVAVLVLLPFAFGVDWPHDPYFYLYAAGAGLSGYVYDLLVYAGVARFGGATIARLLPLRIGLVFAFWCLLRGDYAAQLFAEPWRGAGVVGALLVAGFAVANLSRHPISRSAFRLMVPATTALAISDIFSKFALNHVGIDHAGLDHGGGTGAAMVLYPILMSALILPLVLFRMARRGELAQLRTLVTDRSWRTASLVAGIAFAAQIAVKGQALHLVPDPSYFVALNTLSALWLTLWYRYRKLPDETDRRAGFVFVAALVVLILCAPRL